MTEREKTHLHWIIGLAIAILILLWLWRRANAGSSTAPVTAGSTGGSGQQTPVTLGLPAPLINLAFQTPAATFTNQPTGYVPLYGFLGYAGNY